MAKKIKQRTALGGRIAKLREEYFSVVTNDKGEEFSSYGMKQCDLAKMIEERMGGECHLTAALISCWETGRRGVPLKYNKALCDIFGVSEEYLLGYTSERDSSETEQSSQEEELFLIREEDLPDYDGEPIWCNFTSYEYTDAWAIYNAAKQTLMFKDGPRKIKRKKDVRFFTKIPDFEDKSAKAKRSLEYSQVVKDAEKKTKKVFVIMNSPDESIREKYNGWYLVDAEGGVLFNPWNSKVLDLNGLNVSYRAYSTGDPAKVLTDERLYQ